MRTDLPIFNGVLAPVAYEALKRGWKVARSEDGELVLGFSAYTFRCRTEQLLSTPSSDALGLGSREESFVLIVEGKLIERVPLSIELLGAIAECSSMLPTCSLRVLPAATEDGEPEFVRVALEHRIIGAGLRPVEVIGVAKDMGLKVAHDATTQMIVNDFGGVADCGSFRAESDTVLTLDSEADEGELVEMPGDPDAQLELFAGENATWRADRSGQVLPEGLNELLYWTNVEAERLGLPAINPTLMAQVCAKRAPQEFERIFGRGSVQRALDLPRNRIEGSGETNLRIMLAKTAKRYDPTVMMIPRVLAALRQTHPEFRTLFSVDAAQLIEPRPHKQTNVKRGDEVIPTDEIRPPLTRTQLEKALKRRVVGQDHVIGRIASRVAMAQRGLTGASNKRPLGVFFFAGPTGVGKTEMAKAIADALFDPGDNMIRLDMSEYSQDWMISKITGPAPGYRGCDQPAGWLTTRVAKNPHSLILLDEFEKADPEIWQVFLQTFDEGHMTDSSGYVADFSKTVIVMTSNIGSQAFTNTDFGFADPTDTTSKAANAERAGRVVAAVRNRLPPELFNRVDEAFVFNALNDEVMTEIAKTRLKQVSAELTDAGYSVKFTPAVAKLVARHESDPSLGARPMNRAIDKLIREPLSEIPKGVYKTAVAQGLIVFRPVEAVKAK